MTADGLPANGRALARTGEHKSDRWRATKWHLVYRGHLDHERLLQRVAVATHVAKAAWSVVHRTTEDEGDLTLFGLMFKAGIDVQGKGVFDVPGADGQTSIRPTASTMKSVSWLKSIFEEHRTLPAIGRWQKYPDDNDWGDCRPKRKRDSFEGCAARRSPAPRRNHCAIRRTSAQFADVLRRRRARRLAAPADGSPDLGGDDGDAGARRRRGRPAVGRLDGLEVGSSVAARRARLRSRMRCARPRFPAGPRQPGPGPRRPTPSSSAASRPAPRCGGGDGARSGARASNEQARAREEVERRSSSSRRPCGRTRAGARGVDGGGDVGGRRGEGGGAAGGGAVARCRALCARGRQPRRRRARGGGGGRADVAAQIAPPREPAAQQATAAIESGRERAHQQSCAHLTASISPQRCNT